MTYIFAVTFLLFLAAGSAPALVAHFILKIRFLGGPWLASLVGIVGAAAGALVDALFLSALPEILAIGGAVDLVPPLFMAILFVALYALVSRSNNSG